VSSLTPEQRRLRARLAAHESWANTEDRSARTEAARKAFNDRFPNENARKAYYARLSFEASKARRRKAGAS
jgi:hypothetical protein